MKVVLLDENSASVFADGPKKVSSGLLEFLNTQYSYFLRVILQGSFMFILSLFKNYMTKFGGAGG
jgi:hypothetical protein